MGQNGVLGSKIWNPFVSKKKCVFWTVLDHWDAILVHFEQNLKIKNISTFWPFWVLFGLFWTLFGPQNGLRSPKTQRETYQNWAKGVQKAIKMCFGTVLDHLANLELKKPKNVQKHLFLDPFWPPFARFFWRKGPSTTAMSALEAHKPGDLLIDTHTQVLL